MNRRSTLTVGTTAVAVVGIFGVAFSTTRWATGQRAQSPTSSGGMTAPVLGPGRGPIPEVAVGPNGATGPVPIAPPLPRIASSSDDASEAATTIRSADVQDSLAGLPMATSLSAAERDGLVWMREEEKLAHDVYTTLAQRWGNGPFTNIAAAESTHTEAVRLLIDRYGIADPALGASVGAYGNPTFTRLYQELVTTGSASYVDGLKVGARIEELDIQDLKARASALADIAMVYDNLERGSRNHLRAFVRQLKRQGVEYAPTLLSKFEYEAIIGGDLETAARR